MPELNTSVSIVGGERVKNEQDRLVILNRVALSVIESVRGQHNARKVLTTFSLDNPKIEESKRSEKSAALE